MLLVKLQRQRCQEPWDAALLPDPEANLVAYSSIEIASRSTADLHRAALSVEDDGVLVLVCLRRVKGALDAHLAVRDERYCPAECGKDGLLELLGLGAPDFFEATSSLFG
jgi:hypothetical protein